MFVPCPHCQFLVAHHPQLRPLPEACPRCGKPLQDDGEPADAGEVNTGTPAQAEAVAIVPGSTPAADAGMPSDPVPDAAAAEAEAEAAAEPGARVEQPDATPEAAAPLPAASGTAPIAPATRPGRWSRWRWPLVALLALLLVLQILLADRARLSEDPRWRPLLETLCGALGCELPAWDEPQAFTMLDRKVRPDPERGGALRVDATFRNDARWSQAWPPLQLALSDADGRVLGSRVFQPADYLGRAPDALLAPGQSAQITFVVQEPAPGTVAFSFEFR